MILGAQVVDWSALGNVVLYSVVVTVGTSIAFSAGIVGVTRFSELRGTGHRMWAGLYATLAAVGLGVCAAAIVFGIVVMINK